MSRHTPGKWTYENSEGMSTPHPYAADGDCAIYAQKLGVAVTCSYRRSKEEQEANAERIVRAVNAHDALLEAAIMAQEFITRIANTMPVAANGESLTLLKLSAAISLAERGAE